MPGKTIFSDNAVQDTQKRLYFAEVLMGEKQTAEFFDRPNLIVGMRK